MCVHGIVCVHMGIECVYMGLLCGCTQDCVYVCTWRLCVCTHGIVCVHVGLCVCAHEDYMCVHMGLCVCVHMEIAVGMCVCMCAHGCLVRTQVLWSGV